MATNYYDDEDDDFTTPEQDTGAMNEVRKANRALEKRLKALEAENNSLKTSTRQRTVKDVLSTKGINQKVAAFIPQDIEPTEEAITTWLSEYGDVFGAVKQEEGQSQSQQSQAQATPDLSANQRINNVVNTGQAPAVDEDMMAKILNAKDADSLNAILGISAI
jgi:hypothetical protein